MTTVSVQLPQHDSTPLLPGWGEDRPAPVLDRERVPARACANCPSRTISTRETPASSRNAWTGQEIRVLLVDTHLSFRLPLAFMLMREPDITIIGQAGTVAEARPLLLEADVALISLSLPDGVCVELIHALRAVNPQAIALVLTGHSGDLAMAHAVAAGVGGVLDKARSPNEIMDAIRRVHAGESLLSLRETMEMLRVVTRQREQGRVARARIDRLTSREREVLQGLGAGMSDRQIAHQLVVSIRTVRVHMTHVLAKLGVDSRLKALIFGLQHDLVTIP
jgi:DNA-binding NarL/FixJ family response regulator